MLRLAARAKINWTLDILGTRPDGYHQMDMLMQSVALADTLLLEPDDQLSLEVANGGTLERDERNLVMRAALALRAYTGCTRGARMGLEKHIPIGAGMGGGSADAAAALIGLNRLWKLGLKKRELLKIGLSLGADVPFLLVGGAARAGGIGEEIEPLRSAPRFDLVIVQPCEPLLTREVFAAYDARPAVRRPDTGAARHALLTRDGLALATSAANVLAPVSEAKMPAIREAKAALLAQGATFAQMTGSGSAVFGVFESASAARRAWAALRGRYPRCERTRTTARGVVLR